jgi:hypothetical protein
MLSTGKIIHNEEKDIEKNDSSPKENNVNNNHEQLKSEVKKEEPIKVNKEEIKKIVSPPQLKKISIIVEFNEDECKFIFYDKNKNLLGNFNVLQLIKYVTEKINNSFINIEIGTSKTIIRQFICKIVEKNGFYKIELLNHLESPFMGNIEMLMKLYKCTHKYIYKNLNIDLESSQINIKIQKKIIVIIKQLEYAILNSMMKLIITISEIIKNDTSKKELDDNLLRYSVIVSYRMSRCMKEEIIRKTIEYDELQADVVRLGKIKLDLYDKISQLTDTIKKQNEQIQTLTSKIDTLTTTQSSSENESQSSNSPRKLTGGINVSDEDETDESDKNNSTSGSDEILDEN